jgi:hypothetical protein
LQHNPLPLADKDKERCPWLNTTVVGGGGSGGVSGDITWLTSPILAAVPVDCGTHTYVFSDFGGRRRC